MQLINGQSPHYRDFPLRLLLSVVAAHYILIHTSQYGFFEVIAVNGYLLSLAASFVIALCLVQVIYQITILLDKHYPYITNWRKRIILQIACGILGVAFLAFTLAYAYFYLKNVTERAPRYFTHDFPIIFAFIIGVNAYYFIRYALHVNKFLFIRLRALIKQNRKQAIENTVADSTTYNTEVASKIAYILKIDREYMVTYTNGSTFAWFKSIKKTIDELPTDEYFAINPTCIVAKDIILSVKPLQYKRYELTLKAPFQEKIKPEDFVVSQTNKQKFQKWFVDN